MQRNLARNLTAVGLAFLAAMLPAVLLHAADTDTTPTVDRIQAMWTETVLRAPDQQGTRGFGGRLMFYDRDGEAPIEVNGTLIVYAFDESTRPLDGTPRERKFVFQGNQLRNRYLESELGHSYSVWLPWDGADGPPKKISLIPRIIPKAGQPVIGESAELRLTQHNPTLFVEFLKSIPIRPASYVEPAMHETIEDLRRERAELQSRLQRVEQELEQARAPMVTNSTTGRPQATVTGSLMRVAEKLEADMRANLTQLWSAWDRPFHQSPIVESSQPLPMPRSFHLLADADDIVPMVIRPDSTATLSGRKPIAAVPDQLEPSLTPRRDAKSATFGSPALATVKIARSSKTFQTHWPEIPSVAPPQPSDPAWLPSETLAMTWPGVPYPDGVSAGLDGPLLGHVITRLPFDFPLLPSADDPMGGSYLRSDEEEGCANVLSFPRMLHKEANAGGPSVCVFREEWLADWEENRLEPITATPIPLGARIDTLGLYSFADGNFVDDVQYFPSGPTFTIARTTSLTHRSSPLPEYKPSEPLVDQFEPDSSLAADALLDDDTLLILAQAVKAYQTKLAVIANNLANAETIGFKASRVNLENLPCRHEELPGILDSVGNYAPVGVTLGMGVCVAGTQTDFTQGSLQEGAQLDVAIVGKGFFQVTNTSGEIQYTRAGVFSTNANGDLVLASSKTGRVIEPCITIPPDATEVVISSEGEVSVRQPGCQGLTAVGSIELANFINPQGLVAEGENLYSETDASGSPTTGTPGQEGLGKLQQGKLEASNVDSTEELIEFKRTAAKLKTIKTILQAE